MGDIKRLYVDANVLLRFLLGTDEKAVVEVEKYLDRSNKGLVELHLISEIIPEIEYVLRKVYKVQRDDLADRLLKLLRIDHVVIESRDLWMRAFELYPKVNIDLMDIFLFVKAKSSLGEVLSFDKDFKKLVKFDK